MEKTGPEELFKEPEKLTEVGTECSICCGTAPAHGGPCICGGVGTREAEIHGLRLEVVSLGIRVEKLLKFISEMEDSLAAQDARLQILRNNLERLKIIRR
jgi:hypothetical protein